MINRTQADIRVAFDKLRLITQKAVQASTIKPVAEEAINIIRRRTRLGYGANEDGGQRFTFKKLSPRYVHFRETKGKRYLSEFAFPGSKSNLTFTGQMLDSMAVIKIEKGRVFIGPTGTRTDKFSKGKENKQIAYWVSKQGRPFMYLTKPEISQVVRFYRKRFGDLIR